MCVWNSFCPMGISLTNEEFQILGKLKILEILRKKKLLSTITFREFLSFLFFHLYPSSILQSSHLSHFFLFDKHSNSNLTLFTTDPTVF